MNIILIKQAENDKICKKSYMSARYHALIKKEEKHAVVGPVLYTQHHTVRTHFYPAQKKAKGQYPIQEEMQSFLYQRLDQRAADPAPVGDIICPQHGHEVHPAQRRRYPRLSRDLYICRAGARRGADQISHAPLCAQKKALCLLVG